MKIKLAWMKYVATGLSVVLGLGLMLTAVLWMAGFLTPKTAPGLEPPPTDVATASDATDVVHEVVKEYHEEAVGTLKAADRTEISARLMAPIEAIRVRAGDAVSTGDVLVELDKQALLAKQGQAKYARDEAQAARTNAEDEFARQEALIRDQATSQAAFDRAKTARDVARARLAKAEQALDEADVMLSYTTIRSPRAGIVVDRRAEPGDTARPGEPLLVLYDPTSLRLEVPVTEQRAVRLQRGDRLQVRIDSLSKDFTATISEIVPQAEAVSRSFLVKVALPPSPDLYEGMFGRLLIPAGSRRHLCLNMAAIRRVGQLEYVEVVDEDDGTIDLRLIQTGRVGMPGRIEVLSGLEAGETVRLLSTAPATDSEVEEVQR